MPAISVICIILAILLTIPIFMTWRLKKVAEWQYKASKIILCYSIYEMLNHTYKQEENNYTKYMLEFNKHYYNLLLWGQYTAFKAEYRSKMKAFHTSSMYPVYGFTSQLLISKSKINK